MNIYMKRVIKRTYSRFWEFVDDDLFQLLSPCSVSSYTLCLSLIMAKLNEIFSKRRLRLHSE